MQIGLFAETASIKPSPRERININKGWRFMRYSGEPDHLIYDERPKTYNHNDDIVADTRASETGGVAASRHGLKAWILPSANDFINNPANRHIRPAGNPGSDFAFVQSSFNDTQWRKIDLPHDWAIHEPFYKEANAIVGGGMGRLPVQGVAWYRKKLNIAKADKGKSIYLDIDGAMSYAMVWLNGNLVGGWPYGYNSFRLDLTPYLRYGADNQLAIRLDNPANSSRWYPGAGIYRNVWLTKVQPVHVRQWGTYVRTSNVSASSAKVDLDVDLENRSRTAQRIKTVTEIYVLNDKLEKAGERVTVFPDAVTVLPAQTKLKINQSVTIKNPLLWEPIPSQNSHRYIAITRLYQNGHCVDEYETRFGIRSIMFDSIKGLLVNGKPIRIQGVNQHHDLGALGAAFNVSAAQRQLEMLRDMGCNAIRLAHNPPAPELLELTDRMGFLVIDEIFDCWERGKTPLDFHLIFPEWHEPDLRAFIRRDRNHPSVIAWSFGNEVGEQYTSEAGAALAKQLYDIVKEEDATRTATASMNYAKPDMTFPQVMDLISLNYQGEGIRDAPAYAYLKGIKTSPLYPTFQKQFPDKMIFSSETASALSSRGTYLFPVFEGTSAPVAEGNGGDEKRKYVSAYDLYSAPFGSSPDKVFATQDKYPYVAGEFVWSGWDYLGEPTPYYTARSSYSGIIDLAGFKKDRFYLYQSRWRPDFPVAHILPHWTWPDRIGKITPVHVYSSGNEAELFLNGKSLGRKNRLPYECRFRWDSVMYEPGELKVITYKNHKPWATDRVKTAGKAAALELTASKKVITADGKDLCFITLRVLDSKGTLVPEANNHIKFDVAGLAEIIATDNGDAADLVSFSSKERDAFNGLALVIIKAKPGTSGTIRVKAQSGMLSGQIVIESK
ncbi:beta-galactosidase GalB [Mucilaginibacter robiniae]|nr:beta-galactosidase GalB [Mucilaginibacter robiniae]